MQGSFWKTVALVAVVGVGSLAILEVQNRLNNSPSALDSSTTPQASGLSADLKAGPETTVNAQLSESDFDKMLKSDFGNSGQSSTGQSSTEPASAMASGFNLNEPGFQTAQSFGETASSSAADFPLADVGQQSMEVVDNWEPGQPFGVENGAMESVATVDTNTVDTNVDASLLSDQPNPFAVMAEDAPSGNLNQPVGVDNQNIQPVGFVADDQPAFAPFDPTAAAASDPSVANSGQNQPSANGVRAGQLQFYNGRSRDDSAEASANPVTENLIAFEEDSQANPLAGEIAASSQPEPFGQFGTPEQLEQFAPSAEEVASPLETGSPFPGFEFEESAPAEFNQPERLPNTGGSMTDQASPFFSEEPIAEPTLETPRSDEAVPAPRLPLSGQPTFEGDASSSNSFEDFSSGSGSGSSSDSLPFAGDSESAVPVLNPVPTHEQGLAIPGASGQSDFGQPNMGQSNFELGRSTFEGNRFDTEPNPLPSERSSGFDDFPAPAPAPERSLGFDSDRNLSGVSGGNPLAPNAFDRTNLGPTGVPPVDRRQDFNERLNPAKPREINPGFDSQPRRIPTTEDRRSIDFDSNTNTGSRNAEPMLIDPGFGTERRRAPEARNPSNRNFNLEDGSHPVREFGGAGRFDHGSRPIRNERGSTESSYDRRQQNLRSVDDRMGNHIRQIASVMRPKLTLQKSAPENATVGNPLQYSIIVRNDGDAPAYDVVVEDEVTSTSQVDAAKPQASRSDDGQHLVWQFESIAPGTEKEIQVQVTPTGEGVIDGVATVKFKSRVKSTTMITAPRLELKMEGPTKVRLGDKVKYRYVITNEGSGEARSVFVRTVLPQNGGLRHPQGQDLEYEIPMMEPGEQREILLSVVAGEPGNQLAKAIVSSRNGSKDEATWSTDVVGAQLQMLRRGPKRRFVSKTARYENIVTNETDFDAVNARVVEKIPPGMEFKAAGQNGRYNPTDKTVTWEIHRLAAKATTTFQLELEPRVAGQQDSRVTIFENIGAQSDDYVSTTVVEDLHNVSATISQLDGPVALGEVFGFTIAVDNRGTADATDVQLSIEVPREIEVFGAGSKQVPASLEKKSNTVIYQTVVRIKRDQQQDFELKLRGIHPGRNKIVKASVKYTQMSEPLEISESVTIYDDRN